MRDVMVDLETLGTAPGCAILSIGAIAFDEYGVAEKGFYQVVTQKSCIKAGLHEDNDTIIWWSNQSDEARKVFTDPMALSITSSLEEFNDFLSQYEKPRVWGNGADFDLGILNAAYHATGLGCPFPFTGRCYRTVKSQYPDIKMMRGGTHHNALDDARSQAEHLVRICQNRGWKLA